MNRLGQESSPYLRQHQDNPVDWYPWGPEAMARAAAEDRPILLSVGYSACHWCHVMAHESFEDAEVASVMNELFVNVKVDREERPDVDAVYMDAVQALSGHGGWPMTVFLTPSGQPFFGGTYYPKPNLLRLLRAVDDAWRTKRPELLAQADQLTEALDRFSQLEPSADLPGVEHLDTALRQLSAAFDPEWGGFGQAPKFPQTMSLELVLRAHAAGAGEAALAIVTTSLDAMASGGMYDHLGGGFARYSVDDHWLVPHFEKMLYDQALLARCYLHAWQVTGEARYAQVLEETIEYVRRDLGQPAGGFSSAEDADSLTPDGHSHEGAFYVWTPSQLREVLGDDLAQVAAAWYGVTEAGNFEGATILHRPPPDRQLGGPQPARQLGGPQPARRLGGPQPARRLGGPMWAELVRPPEVEQARRLLFEARSARPRPGLDDKVLTEWNALFLATLAEAAAATGRDDWKAAAIAGAEFLLTHLRRDDDRWLRSWQHDGGARHLALAADHAALVGAFVALAEATGEARWIEHATATADALLDLFWDPIQGGLFTTGVDGEALVARQKDVLDNATPSANSMAALALQRLAALTGELRFANHADQILQLVGPLTSQSPLAFAHLLAAVDQRRVGLTEIAVVGDRPDLRAAVRRRYLPNAVLAWGEPYPSPLWDGRQDGLAYVCRDFTCQAPTGDVATLEAQLSGI